MASINNPFKSVDFSDMPPLQRFTAADGAALAYRYYSPNGAAARGSVVLVHGSSASSNSMHVLAKAFAKAGYAAYALDIRGHGGLRGRKEISTTSGSLKTILSRSPAQLHCRSRPPLPGFLRAVDLFSASPAVRGKTCFKAIFCCRHFWVRMPQTPGRPVEGGSTSAFPESSPSPS